MRRPHGYADLCERSWTISPAEERFERAAIFLPGEPEKVCNVQEDTTMEAEIERITGGMRHHAQTRAYRLRNVELAGGRLIKGAMSHRISALEDDPGGRKLHMSSAAISSTLMGSMYFGHWMHDDLALNLAVQAMAPTIHVARKAYSHESGYRELLSVSENHAARGRFDELILLDDWGQNEFKRRRYEDLRSRLRRQVSGTGRERIYIKRGRTSGNRGRDLMNAPQIEALLAQQGFAIADPDVLGARQIASLCKDARLIVSLEGSHLAHAIFPIAHDGTILVLQPPHRFNNVFKDLTDAVGLRYAFVVGTPTEGGFDIDPERLQRTLELVPA